MSPPMEPQGGGFRLSLRLLAGDTLLYGGVAGLSRLSTVLIVPLAARSLTVDAFGILDTLWTLTTLLLLLGNGGVDLAITYYYHNAPPERRASYVVTGLLLRAGLGLLVSVIAAAAASAVSAAAFGTTAWSGWVTLMVVVVPFSLLVTYSLDLLRNQRRRRWFVLLSAARLVLFLAAVGWLTLRPPDDFIGSLLLLRVIPEALVLILLLFLLRGSFPLRAARPEAARDLLRYGLPMVPANLFLWLLGFVDRWHLYDRGLTIPAGEYAMAVKVGMLVMLVVAAVQMAYNPLVSAFRSADDAGVFTARAFSLTMAGAMALVLLLAAHLPPLLRIAGGPAYAGAAVPAAILLVGNLGAVASVFFATAANLERRTGAHAAAGLAAVTVAVAGCRLLLPVWGTAGVATAIAAAQYVYALIVLLPVRRARPIPFPVGRVGAALILCAAVSVTLPLAGLSGVTATATAVIAASVILLLVVSGGRHPALRRTA